MGYLETEEEKANKKLTKELKDKAKEINKEIEEIKKEVVAEPKKTEPTEKYMVVDKIPVQEVRQTTDEDGNIINFITTEEALTQVMNA